MPSMTTTDGNPKESGTFKSLTENTQKGERLAEWKRSGKL